jgi:hypothetical protein
MSRPTRTPAGTHRPKPDEISPDTPLRLAVAAALAYPDGSMTASGLRREGKRGRLVIERVAGKDYTTLGHIERMRELCRLEAKAPAFTSGAHGTTKPDVLRIPQYGLSETAAISEARVALRTILMEPSAPLPRTSPKST